ncbi:MAG: tRNA (adenosine(37)-N6)-dimethylallyltransferase MiaA, partial [Lachnospiraceae bacterium]|nr:tRNA (adenosine(37)-N6)-dimethylallyltransferase MiaA [Lachnospiraceae bacterium]
HFAYFVLMDDRQNLYDRIEKRIDLMLADGLLDEVKRLQEEGYTKDMVSMQGIGYKEILDYLDGKYDYERAVTLLKQDTRHFAKRQLTWFKRERFVTELDKDSFSSEDELLAYMLSILKDKKIV